MSGRSSLFSVCLLRPGGRRFDTPAVPGTVSGVGPPPPKSVPGQVVFTPITPDDPEKPARLSWVFKTRSPMLFASLPH